MPVALKGSTSGDITLTAPAVAGATTITLPATTGNAVVDVATQTLTNKTLTSPTLNSPTINTPTMGGSVLTQGTAQNASGTEVPFTGIPSWVKRITLMMSGVSTNGTSVPIIQLGTSSGYETSGYLGSAGGQAGGAVGTTIFTAGFGLNASATAAYLRNGSVTITNITGNTWTASGTVGNSEAAVVSYVGGSKALSSTLDRVRVTTVNGTDTFDAGTVNILYE
jgi:hypothetical protein